MTTETERLHQSIADRRVVMRNGVKREGRWRRFNRWILRPTYYGGSDGFFEWRDRPSDIASIIDGDHRIDCDIEVHFSFRDRLRLLLFGRLGMMLCIKTEHDAGTTEPRSTVTTA